MSLSNFFFHSIKELNTAKECNILKLSKNDIISISGTTILTSPHILVIDYKDLYLLDQSEIVPAFEYLQIIDIINISTEVSNEKVAL